MGGACEGEGMMLPSVVVVGSSNTDLVITSKRLPRPGETVLGGAFQVVAGGKGANQAVAAARAGARVTFVANIGRDGFGDAALRRLKAEGIRTRWVARSGTAPSGVALILVGARGENVISVARSSNSELSVAEVESAGRAIQRARVVVAQLEVPLAAVARAVEMAAEAGVPVLLNPAPARGLPKRLLGRVTWLTPNASELGCLTGREVESEAGLVVAARSLQRAGVAHVLVTCGARGVCWCDRAGVRWIPAPRVKAVDTVGAGDCFSGALAAALARGWEVEAAIRFAVQAASISVTRAGAQPSMPRREEIESSMNCRQRGR